MSADNVRSFYEKWPSRMSRAKAATPDAVKGFHALFQAVMKEGVLGVREKELIALVG